jgi:NitT/TauT family transport system substrate-binding protein
MFVWKRYAAALAAALGAVGIIGLGLSPELAVAQAKLTPIKVGVLKIAGLANAYAAKKEKMFEKNGLDAALVEFRSGDAMLLAAQSGGIDVALVIPGTGMTADEHGFDFRVVFQNEIVKDHAPDSGSVQALAGNGINTLSDLVGKKIAVSQISSQMAVTAMIALRKAGVDPSNVRFVVVPYPQQVEALKSKQVDAIVTTEPYTTQLITSGTGKVLAWNYLEAGPGTPLGIWWSRQRYIEKNPDTIARFDESIKESIDYMNADPARARQRTVEFTGLDPALVEKMPPLRFDYHVSTAKWQIVVDMMYDAKILEKPHKATEYFSDALKPYIEN